MVLFFPREMSLEDRDFAICSGAKNYVYTLNL
jgi:hypothetical protein